MTSGSSRLNTTAARARCVIRALRTEGSTLGQRTLAVGVGVFIGCSPFYGMHLAISYVVGALLGVNRLTVYLAAQVSNPLTAPLLVFSEMQAGTFVRQRTLPSLTLEEMRRLDPWSLGFDLLLGAAVVGSVLGVVAAGITYVAGRRRRAPEIFDEVALRAADRYAESSITAWEFGRAKLRSDPGYRQALMRGALHDGDTLVDFGCGQGLMLALLIEADAAWRGGRWPTTPRPPSFRRLVGVERRPCVVRLARVVTAGAADIEEVDGREFVFPPCDAILFFDVLQMMPRLDQVRLLRRAANSLAPGGVIVVREADAAAGHRFLRVRIGNRAKALITGAWRQPLCYRRADEWMALFAEIGLVAELLAPSLPGPFANVMFRVLRPLT